MPGTMSILTRNCATAHWWLTSLQRINTLTGLFTGRCSSGVDIKMSSAPLGSFGSMPNGLSGVMSLASVVPNTSTAVASFGTVTNLAHTNKPGANIAATPTEVTMVSHHSSFLFSGEYSEIGRAHV